MSQTVVLADAVTCWNGTEPALIEFIPAEHEAMIFATEERVEALRPLRPDATFVAAGHLDVLQRMIESADKFFAEEPPRSVALLTHHGRVKATLSEKYGGKLLLLQRPPYSAAAAPRALGGVDAVQPPQLRAANVGQTRSDSAAPYTPHSWPGKTISYEDALGALRRALRAELAYSRESAVRLTDLRPVLSDEHPAFDVRKSDETRIPGFMRRFAASAKAAGFAEFSFGPSGRDLLWLTEERPSVVAPPAPTVLQAVIQPATANSRGAEPLLEKYRALHEKDQPLKARVREVYTEGTFGPFATTRKELYGYLKAHATAAGQPVLTVVAKAIADLRAAHPAGGSMKLPVKALPQFLLNVLAASEVLLDKEGNRARADFPSKAVHGIVEGFELELDQAVVAFWFETGGELALSEVPDFAHYIFSSGADGEQRLHAIFERLQQDGRLTFMEGKYRRAGNIVPLSRRA